MKRLSALDTLFVTLDNPRFPLHGAGILVLDPSTSPEPYTYGHVRDHLAKVLPVMPPLRRRLVEVPLGLTSPVWVEDPDFDLDRHIHRVAVPPPGQDQELAELADEIGSLPLSWDRPLWDLWFIEGLADDRVAIMIRMHHCAIDGMGGIEMLFQMFSLSADSSSEATPDTWEPEHLPSQAEMLLHAVPSIAVHPLRSARSMLSLALGMARRQVGAKPPQQEGGGSARLFSATKLPFNTIPPGVPRKVTSWASIPMTDVKSIRALHGGTVNDVALALTAGSLRRWLQRHNALPDGPITCANPVNVRAADEDGLFENRFAIFSVPLPTHLSEPEARYQAVSEATALAKASSQAAGTNIIDNLFRVLSPGVAELIVAGLQVGLGSNAPSPYNTLVTNLQGPPIPLFLAGARLERFHVQMMQVSGMSLIVALITYAGQMQITVTGHRENTPGIWELANGIEEEARMLLTSQVSGVQR